MISPRQLSVASLFLLLFAAGCTVQPLHSTNASTSKIDANVAIEPVDTRLEQEVRNRLIFLLNGGSAEPSDPRFLASLNVTSQSRNLLEVDRGVIDSETTSTSLTITGTLILADTSDENVAKTFVREARVSYDRSTQFFANSRANIDAENRAALVLAEELRNLVLVYVKTQ